MAQTKFCIENDIRLLRISYKDFKNIKLILNKELCQKLFI